MTRGKQILWVGLALSIVAHAVLVGVLLWGSDEPIFVASSRPTAGAPGRSAEDAGPSDISGGASPPKPDPVDATDTPPDELAEHMAEAEADIEQMSETERELYLSEKIAQAEQITSEQSVQEMVPLVRKTVGARDRAYAPVADAPPGPFDHDTALIHSVKREPHERGGEQAYFVMVDAAGRSLEVPVPENTSPAVIAAVEKMHASPVLKQIYEQMVLPALDARASPPAPADDSPEPP